MRSLTICVIVAAILVPATFLRAQSLIGSRDVCTVGKTIASRRMNNVDIVLRNERGALAEGNSNFCVEFRKTGGGVSVDVRSVSVDFSQQVGRIREAPIAAQISQESAGAYLGRVDLGRQYYNPAVYYAVIQYVDLAGKKRKARFPLALR